MPRKTYKPEEVCKQNLSAANWSSATSTRKPTSAFVVGRGMQHRRGLRLRELLALFDALLLNAAGNWG